jgi:hypothetical protein
MNIHRYMGAVFEPIGKDYGNIINMMDHGKGVSNNEILYSMDNELKSEEEHGIDAQRGTKLYHTNYWRY